MQESKAKPKAKDNRKNKEGLKETENKKFNLKKFLKIIGSVLGIFILIITISVAVYLHFNKDKSLVDIARGIIGEIPVSEQYKNRVNVLVVGLDKEKTRTDVDMLVSFYPKKNKVDIFQIPRDTMVKFDDVDVMNLQSRGVKSSNIPLHRIKLTEAFSCGGINMTEYAVEKITGVSVNKYMKVDLTAFKGIVDEIGGIDMYVPMNMVYYDPTQALKINLRKGYQHLDGNKAEQFVRFRHYPMGDLQRIQAQKQFLSVLSKKLMSSTGVFHAVPILNTMAKYTENDVESSGINAYAIQALRLQSKDIVFHSIIGDAPPASTTGGVSYFVCDEAKTKAMITKTLLDGEENLNSQSNTLSNSQVSVEVLNSTSKNGLAKKVAENLKSQGFNIVDVSNFKANCFEKTKIIKNTTSKDGTHNIYNVIGKGTIEDSNSYLEYTNKNADVVLILGKDMQ